MLLITYNSSPVPLTTLNQLKINAAWPSTGLQKHALPFLVGHVSKDSTGRAALRGLPCCLQQHGLVLPWKHCILF